MNFDLTPEQDQLRDAVRALGRKYGHGYFVEKARAGAHTTELWQEAGRLGYLGVNIPTEYGGGGRRHHRAGHRLRGTGRGRLPAAAARGLARHRGHRDQQARHRRAAQAAPARPRRRLAEDRLRDHRPEAGSNFHRLGTVARRDGDDWLLTGRKCYISGVDEAGHVLVVARTEDSSTGKLKPALFIVPTDAPGLERSKLDMEILSPENQFLLYLDDVRLPADALVGESLDAGLPALFAGLNPERITVAAMGAGTGRYGRRAGQRVHRHPEGVGRPSIGTHQGVAHPLAHAAVQVELARLMIHKAATLYDAGRDLEAGVAGNMAKYAAGEAAALAVDTAVQALGGAGMTTEYGVATLLGAVRAGRIAPVSREMILNFVAQHVLGQDKSY
ncbi:hypothetical protein Nm8I071_08200 [Nonomuraea sp. TT08I-71]|nr:hypothetical protein Nm8I071_08200 [Nonomuraea sp. TT08I-71]